ncbi:MAG: carboxypeptidase regulatory-like domain-containing protein, partial [Planctomycetota bacterium]
MTRRTSLFLTLGAVALAAIIGGTFLLADDGPGDGGPDLRDQETIGGGPQDLPTMQLPDPGTSGGGATAPADVSRPVEVIGTGEPSTMVIGRVITRSGHPLPDAVISPYRLVRDPPFSNRVEIPRAVRSDQVGRFDIAALPTGVTLGLEVRHENHAPQLRETFVAIADETVDLGDIVLGDGMTLSGTVTDEDNLPVPGARIALSEVSGGLKRDPSDSLAEALTDQEGRYEIAHLALRQYSIDVSAEGYGRVTNVLSLVLATSSGGWTQDFKLETDDSMLGGVVIGPDEQPLPDIGVRISRRQRTGNSYYLRTLRTSADGSFFFDALPDGRYQFDLDAEGWYLQKPLELAAGSEEHLIRALPGLVVDGQLVVQRGEAPRDFHVIIRPDGRTGAGLLELNAYERDLKDSEPAGSFSIGGLRPGSYRFEIRAEGFATTTSSDVIIGAAAGGANVLINLLRGGTVEGHVSPASEGVTVELRGAEYDPSLAIEATFPTPPIHGLRTTTDEEGRFRFDHVPPEVYTVSARPTASPPAHKYGILVNDESRNDIGTLTLAAGGAIVGNVLGTDGRPTQGVRITALGHEHQAQAI